MSTMQRLNAFIHRIAGAQETMPAEIRDQYPQAARAIERPVVIGYSVWPR